MRYRKRPKRRNIGAPVEAPSSAYPAAHTADNYDQHDAPTPSAEHPSRAIHNNAHRPAQDRRMRGIASREDYDNAERLNLYLRGPIKTSIMRRSSALGSTMSKYLAKLHELDLSRQLLSPSWHYKGYPRIARGAA